MKVIKKFYQKYTPIYIRNRFYKLRINARKQSIFISTNLFDKNVRNFEKRLSTFDGIYKGNRCIIMGNGPSLNKMDLEIFKNEFVWGTNRCYLLFDRISWRPKFYTAVDTRVVPDNADEINALSEKLKESNFFFPVHFRYEGILRSNKNVYWYNEVPLTVNKLPYSMFSTNILNNASSVYTVTVAALQLAVFLGFNPIYLIGCDTSYSVPETVKIDSSNPDWLTSTTNDPNHFSGDYFGEGKKWHEPHVDRMIFHYKQAKLVCDEIGVSIVNATVGGNLEVFPRINYLDLFK